jgi:DNA-directed RNA polymerase subunit L
MDDKLDKMLDELLVIAPQYKQKTEQANFETVQDQLRLLRDLRDITEILGDIKTQFQNHLDRMRQDKVPTAFKENGITSLTVDGYRYTISQTLRASIKADQKVRAYEWLRENDLGELITETVNASTLSAQARKMAEDGTELEPDLFNVSIVPTTSITQAK